MRLSVRIIPILLLSVLSTAWAAVADRIATTIDKSQTIVLKGNVHPEAQPQYDQGRVERSMKLPHITMLMKPSTGQQAEIKKLLAEQQDPSSPKYHKWLTPEQYGKRFGMSQNDLNKITNWLLAEGFTITQVANGREWIAFSGTAELADKVFRTEIHTYLVDGEKHFANATEPSIPTALAGVVVGFRGLNDFGLHPMGLRKLAPGGMLFPDVMHSFYTAGGGHSLAPDDLATIYNIAPLYAAGIDGTGMKLVIVGQTDIQITDLDNFRAGFNLSKNDPQQMLAAGCSDPGITGDQTEADLDLEWSGAVARNATIIFVKCDLASGGVFTSAFYAIDQNLAPVISMSYGGCESLNAGAGIAQVETELQKANTEGITFLASSGDSGAAACDNSGAPQATMGLAVNYPASSPEVTGVGGNEFNEGAGTYWNPTNTPNGESATAYIPEMAWNDTALNHGLAATGGGASSCIAENGSGTCTGGFPKPTWQTGPGVPSDGVRDVPDISLTASADHDGYILCTAGSCPTGNAAGIAAAVAANSIFGGTSASAPSFAGIVTLLNQYLVKNGTLTNPGLGNINLKLYPLAQSTPGMFHDVPTGSNNIVPCQPGTTGCPNIAPFQYGYQTGTGYDRVTGLGSVDAHVFVTQFNGKQVATVSTLASPTPSPVLFGSSVTFTATVTPAPAVTNPPQTVQFTDPNPPRGRKPLGTAPLNSAGVATLTITNLPGGNNSVIANYGGDTAFGASSSAALPFVVEDVSIAASPNIITISAPGGSGTSTITVTPQGGFNQAVSFSCPASSLPSEATCTFKPASVTPNGAAVTTTLTVQTMPPSAQLQHPAGRSSVFFAMLVPGLLGLAMLNGSRTRTSRHIRLLGLIAILALSTLWMPACGGGSSTGPPSNPGTPVGSTNMMVTASTGTTPLGSPVSITVTVQ
jgi:pro-kumamolisin-like protein/Big-like domain-containing protein